MMEAVRVGARLMMQERGESPKVFGKRWLAIGISLYESMIFKAGMARREEKR